MARDKCAAALANMRRHVDAGNKVDARCQTTLASELEEHDKKLDPAINLAEDTFEAFLNLLLIARSNSYIWGDGWRPSVGDWLGSYPLSGRDVTQSFSKYRRGLLNFLLAKERIDNLVHRTLISTK
jgi:hypothetical protein